MSQRFAHFVLLLTIWCLGVTLVAPRIVEGLKDLDALSSHSQAAPSMRELCRHVENVEHESHEMTPPAPVIIAQDPPPASAQERQPPVRVEAVTSPLAPPLLQLTSTLKISRGPPRA